LEQGTHTASTTINCVRNKLAFHWDPELIQRWVKEAGVKEDPVIWAEGKGASWKETIYRASIDSLIHGIVPPGDLKAHGNDREKAFAALMPGITEAMEALQHYFDAAMLGFLRQHGFRSNGPDVKPGTF
jgi:hypothetical protein